MLFMHLLSQPASLLWRYWRPWRRGILIDTYNYKILWFLFLVHVCFFRSIVEFATWELSGPAAKTSTAMPLPSPSKMRSHPKLVSVATPKFSRWKRSLPRPVWCISIAWAVMNANAIWMPLRFTMVSMERFTANTAMRSTLDISKSPATKAGWTSKLLWARKANATLVRDVPERYFVFFYGGNILSHLDLFFYRFLRLNELLHVLETTIKIVSAVLNVTKNWTLRLAAKVIGNDPNRRIF